MTIVDDSKCSIVASLWGEMCGKTLNLHPKDIITIKGAKISDFGGKSINVASDHSELIINPVHPKA